MQGQLEERLTWLVQYAEKHSKLLETINNTITESNYELGQIKEKLETIAMILDRPSELHRGEDIDA